VFINHYEAVKLAAVCGFPLGSSSTHAKALEAKDLVANGANEVIRKPDLAYNK
jgi:deoxyribose-phosphate aldolase